VDPSALRVGHCSYLEIWLRGGAPTKPSPEIRYHVAAPRSCSLSAGSFVCCSTESTMPTTFRSQRKKVKQNRPKARCILIKRRAHFSKRGSRTRGIPRRKRSRRNALYRHYALHQRNVLRLSSHLGAIPEPVFFFTLSFPFLPVLSQGAPHFPP
jgi:hypothetical protein